MLSALWAILLLPLLHGIDHRDDHVHGPFGTICFAQQEAQREAPCVRPKLGHYELPCDRAPSVGSRWGSSGGHAHDYTEGAHAHVHHGHAHRHDAVHISRESARAEPPRADLIEQLTAEAQAPQEHALLAGPTPSRTPLGLIPLGHGRGSIEHLQTLWSDAAMFFEAALSGSVSMRVECEPIAEDPVEDRSPLRVCCRGPPSARAG